MTPVEIVTKLQNAEIESRPAWKPMHMQPLFKNMLFATDGEIFDKGGECVGTGKSVDEDIFSHSLCLPSGDTLTTDQIDQIVKEIANCFA